MPSAWVVASAIQLCVVAPVFAAEPTPLMPHPAAGRPVFSQDKYARDIPAEAELKDVAPPPKYSQDRYDLDEKPDYSDELRKVPQKGREQSEIDVAKGIIQLNASNYGEAERFFKAALEQDPRNFIAMEYLGAVEEGRGNLQEALAWLVKAKHSAPEPRWGVINFQLGRLYLFLQNYERSEVYLRLAIDQGGHLTAAHYTLGYLYYKQGRYFESHDQFSRAKLRALRPASRQVERAMLQPIEYYLGEIDARLGFTQYAITNLRQTEYGDSWEVRNAAWRVHSELNKPSWRLILGSYLQYDSNTILLPEGKPRPSELNSEASIGMVHTVDGGWQSSPAKRWSVGVDGAGYFNTHFDSSLAAFDVLSFMGDVWLNFWNQKDWSIKGDYQLDHALVDRNSFTTFQTMHGPGISATYVPFQRWNYQIGARYRINSYADDLPAGPDVRSGSSYVAFLNVSFKAPNPRLRPLFGYRFELDDSEGVNFDTREHTLHVELAYRLFDRTHLTGVAEYTKVLFPNNLLARDDSWTLFRLGVNHLLNEHWMIIGDLSQLNNASTVGDYQYSRFTMTGGVTYTF